MDTQLPAFTLGPWRYKPVTVGHPDNRRNPIVTAAGRNIARLFSDEATVPGLISNAPTALEAEANARLIAAAPDLYRAVVALLDEHQDCKGCASSDLALAALAAVKGETT